MTTNSIINNVIQDQISDLSISSDYLEKHFWNYTFKILETTTLAFMKL